MSMRSKRVARESASDIHTSLRQAHSYLEDAQNCLDAALAAIESGEPESEQTDFKELNRIQTVLSEAKLGLWVSLGKWRRIEAKRTLAWMDEKK